VEVRRESFLIHPSYGYKGEEENEADDDSRFMTDWREQPHPEFMIKDLDDLIDALQCAKRYIANRGST
jgi:hypothetical protein